MNTVVNINAPEFEAPDTIPSVDVSHFASIGLFCIHCPAECANSVRAHSFSDLGRLNLCIFCISAPVKRTE